jgi:kynurenine formamidase
MTRRDAVYFAAGALAGAAASAGSAAASPRPPGEPRTQPATRRVIAADKVLDLTHTLSPAFPIWPGNEPIKLTNKSTVAKAGFYANRWDVGEHHGTHLDAPAHCSVAGPTAEKIDPAGFVAPAAVIDLRERAKADPDAAVSVDDLRAWEKAHGRLPAGCAVCLNSGWDARAGDAKAFLGAGASGGLRFPGFSKAAAEFLLHERVVAGLLVDTLSIDTGAATDFTVHKVWLGAGRWAVECVANLGRVPPSGATVFVGAPKVEEASGGPTRVLAVWG